MTSTREHLRTVHHMPGLLYAGLDPEAVHWQAHETAARSIMERKYGAVGLVSDENVAMLAAASIEEETR